MVYNWYNKYPYNEEIPKKELIYLNKLAHLNEEIYHFNADHIIHFKNEEAKKDAIALLWEVNNYIESLLCDLGEIKHISDEDIQKKDHGVKA